MSILPPGARVYEKPLQRGERQPASLSQKIAASGLLVLLMLAAAACEAGIELDPYAAGERAYEREKAYQEGVMAAMEKDLAKQRAQYIAENRHRFGDYCTVLHLQTIEYARPISSRPDTHELTDDFNPYNRVSHRPSSQWEKELWKEYCINQWEPHEETPKSYYEFFVKGQRELLNETICPLTEKYTVVRGGGPASGGKWTTLSIDGYDALQNAGLYFKEVRIAFHYCENDWLQPSDMRASDSPTPPPFIITVGTPIPSKSSDNSIPTSREDRNLIMIDLRTPGGDR